MKYEMKDNKKLKKHIYFWHYIQQFQIALTAGKRQEYKLLYNSELYT